MAVGLALTLAAAANGCEIIANFDRSLIPSEGGVDAAFDANFDAAAPEDTGTDTSAPGVDSGFDAMVVKPAGDGPAARREVARGGGDEDAERARHGVVSAQRVFNPDCAKRSA